MSDMGKLPGNTESLLDLHIFNGWKQIFFLGTYIPLNIEEVCVAKILIHGDRKPLSVQRSTDLFFFDLPWQEIFLVDFIFLPKETFFHQVCPHEDMKLKVRMFFLFTLGRLSSPKINTRNAFCVWWLFRQVREVLLFRPSDLGTISSWRFRFHSAKCWNSTLKYINAVSNLFLLHSLVFSFFISFLWDNVWEC